MFSKLSKFSLSFLPYQATIMMWKIIIVFSVQLRDVILTWQYSINILSFIHIFSRNELLVASHISGFALMQYCYEKFIIEKQIGDTVCSIYYWQFGNFCLISSSDIVSISELTLMLKIISQCDVKHIMTILINRTCNF